MKIYPSKIDFSVVAILGVLILLLDAAVTGIAVSTLAQLSFDTNWGFFLALLGVSALFLLLIAPVSYTLTSSELIVRSGLLRWHIPLDQIQRVAPSHNPRPGPSLSLDRLLIEYLQGSKVKTLLISPRGQHAFLKHLAEADDNLTVADNGLVRTAGKVVRLYHFGN